jgi:hypothetical protein
MYLRLSFRESFLWKSSLSWETEEHLKTPLSMVRTFVKDMNRSQYFN